MTHSSKQRVIALEKDKISHAETAKAFKLQLEELLRGLSENVDQENLGDKLRAIFHLILGDAATANMELSRVHRALGPKHTDPNRPRDVICHLHILRKAWETGIIELDCARVKILPDVSKPTLQRRALLRPVLDQITQTGCTYPWRFPFMVTIRKNYFPLSH